mgnify:FL=1
MEVKFDNVNFYYDKKSKLKVLDSIKLGIKSNTIVGITGKSGSGKTTLVEVMCGIITPTSGKVTIGDIVINKKHLYDDNSLKNKIGYVTQNSEDQIFNSTVKEELTYSFKFLGKTISDDKIIEVLDLVGLSYDYLLSNPLTLSTGEMRKLTIASTILLDNDIIVLDEPTKGLDHKSVRNIERLIKNLKNNFNKTVIVISRDVEFINRVSDQVVIMNEGKILISGNKYDVFKNIDLLEKYDLSIPNTIKFSTIVLNKKNIKIGYRDEINDLLKDIYRYVR